MPQSENEQNISFNLPNKHVRKVARLILDDKVTSNMLKMEGINGKLHFSIDQPSDNEMLIGVTCGAPKCGLRSRNLPFEEDPSLALQSSKFRIVGK